MSENDKRRVARKELIDEFLDCVEAEDMESAALRDVIREFKQSQSDLKAKQRKYSESYTRSNTHTEIVENTSSHQYTYSDTAT